MLQDFSRQGKSFLTSPRILAARDSTGGDNYYLPPPPSYRPTFLQHHRLVSYFTKLVPAPCPDKHRSPLVWSLTHCRLRLLMRAARFSAVSERPSTEKMVTPNERVGKYLFDVALHRKGCASCSRRSLRGEICCPSASIDQHQSLSTEEIRGYTNLLRRDHDVGVH